MADEKEVWRFRAYDEGETFIDDDGDIVCGEEGCSTFRVIAPCVSTADAERIIKAVNGESPVTRFKSPIGVFSVSRNPGTGGAIVLLTNTKYETSKITLGKVSAMQMALELLTQTNQVAEAIERLSTSTSTQTPEG